MIAAKPLHDPTRGFGRHAFDLAVAGLAALAAAFVAYAIPADLLGQAIAATGLPHLLAAAEPPLGLKARALIGAAGALTAFGLVFMLLRLLDGAGRRKARSRFQTNGDGPRLRRRDNHPDAPVCRPISASRDLGEPAPPPLIRVADPESRFVEPAPPAFAPAEPFPPAFDPAELELDAHFAEPDAPAFDPVEPDPQVSAAAPEPPAFNPVELELEARAAEPAPPAFEPADAEPENWFVEPKMPPLETAGPEPEPAYAAPPPPASDPAEPWFVEPASPAFARNLRAARPRIFNAEVEDDPAPAAYADPEAPAPQPAPVAEEQPAPPVEAAREESAPAAEPPAESFAPTPEPAARIAPQPSWLAPAPAAEATREESARPPAADLRPESAAPAPEPAAETAAKPSWLEPAPAAEAAPAPEPAFERKATPEPAPEQADSASLQELMRRLEQGLSHRRRRPAYAAASQQHAPAPQVFPEASDARLQSAIESLQRLAARAD